MGLFDELKCQMDLPDGADPDHDGVYQTKSMDEPYLDQYVITADGHLVQTSQVWEGDKTGRKPFHGFIYFYDGEREYTAKFTDDVCVQITKGKPVVA